MVSQSEEVDVTVDVTVPTRVSDSVTVVEHSSADSVSQGGSSL